MDDVWLTARRIDGQFPNYKQLLPETFEAEIQLPRDEFLEIVRRASLMAQRKSPLRLRFESGELTVSAQTQDVGEARESIAVNYKGRDIAIAFNPVYLMDPLKALDNDEVFLELIDELSPGVVKINGPFLYVLMPMRMS